MLDKKTRDLLPTIIRETMDAITLTTNAPDEMTLPVTLAVANFATQGLTNVHPNAWDARVPLSEYFVVLVPSGGMKTSIFDMLSVGIRKYEREQEPVYIKALVDYKIAVKKFNKDIDEAVKNNVLVPPVEPVKPKGNRYLVEKATVNGLLNTLDAVPFAGLFSSDAGEFFSSHSFQDVNKANEMVSTLSKAWSGEDLNRTTGITENNIKLHDRRFNMLVMLQHQLAGFLNNSQYKDQGFTNRMLITQCELFNKVKIQVGHISLLKQQLLPLEPFNERVYELLDSVSNAQEAVRKTPLVLPGEKDKIWQRLQARQAALNTTNPNELILPTMYFDANAEQFIVDYYNDLSDRQSMAKYAEYSNFMSRAFEHFTRLAATLAAFDKHDTISLNMAECAKGLMEYFIEQRLNLEVEGSVTVSPVVDLCNKVHKWLTKRPNMEATKSELHQGPLQKIDKMLATKIMEELESRGLIEVISVPTKFKPKNSYRAIVNK